jgi:hypothetical protein
MSHYETAAKDRVSFNQKAAHGRNILGTALAILIMWKYNITEETAHQIQEELKERRGEL